MTTAVRDMARGEALYRKLKPGPGHSADEVLANQCARLCGAMVELVAARGYERVTIRGLAQVAGVSTKTFYKCFANVEECFAVTYTRVAHDMLKHASVTPDDGEDPLRARSRAAFEALARDPKSARLLLVDFYSAGPNAVEKARAAGRAFERRIKEELAVTPEQVHLPPSVARGLFGGALRVARSWLADAAEADHVDAASLADWLLAVRDERLAHLCRNVAGEPRTNLGSSRRTPTIGDERQFLLAAAAKLGASRGYRNLSLAAIRHEAGVARRSFDAHFSDVTHCFLGAVESRFEGAVELAEHDARKARSWDRGVVRMIACLCAQVSRDPELAQLGFIEIEAPGLAGLRLREGLITRWAERLRQSAPARDDYTMVAAEASVAASWSMARVEAVASRAERIGILAPPMAFVILAPAIGPAAAERAIVEELELGPVEQVRRHRPRVS